MKRVIRNSEDIFGMSLHKKDVEADLEQTTRKLIQHLIKLYFYPNSDDVRPWRKEVYNFLHNVSRIKGRNKFPSKKLILNNTIGINETSIATWAEVIYDDFSENLGEPERNDLEDMTKRIKSYYDWLADQLSAKGEVSRKAVYIKLESLGF